jgi:heme exporter protein C
VPSTTPSTTSNWPFWVLFALAAGLFGATLYATFWVAPVEATMGIVQKVFYLHVPAAIAMQVLFVISGIASLVVLYKGSLAADRLAVACANVGVAMSLCVLISGPLWARKAWGHYWEWEPRLTLTMVLALLFAAYVALRAYGGGDPLTRKIAAGIAVSGIPAIYLVRVAVEWWGGTHPRVIWTGGLQDFGMRLSFYLGIFAFLAISALLVHLSLRIERAQASLESLTLDAAARFDLEDDT